MMTDTECVENSKHNVQTALKQGMRDALNGFPAFAQLVDILGEETLLLTGRDGVQVAMRPSSCIMQKHREALAYAQAYRATLEHLAT